MNPNNFESKYLLLFQIKSLFDSKKKFICYYILISNQLFVLNFLNIKFKVMLSILGRDYYSKKNKIFVIGTSLI